VRVWARQAAERHPELLRAGHFGSHARGDWGVGSDVDLLAIVTHADRPWAERSRDWDLLALPVPAQLLVYTAEEWQALLAQGGRFARTQQGETVWVYERAA
jgi:hypothetical protein